MDFVKILFSRSASAKATKEAIKRGHRHYRFEVVDGRGFT
jgi:hypothetical protein